MDGEMEPLLWKPASDASLPDRTPHHHFCTLAGIPPSNLLPHTKWPTPPKTSIYQRAIRKRNAQHRTYLCTAVLTNTLLLSQIVIGAILTALGASSSPGIYVAIFGALNTVIAGLVTYIKSRGQPARSRMYKDDLERVVDQIENSETMWLGISKGMHGYDEIDIDDEVSVRSEIARLTRLYDRAVRAAILSNPELLVGQQSSGDTTTGLRARPVAAVPADVTVPTSVPVAPAAHAEDAEEAPATKVKTPDLKAKSDPESSKSDDKAASPAAAAESSKANGSSPAPVVSPVASAASTSLPPPVKDDILPLAADIDEGPVTRIEVKKKEEV